VVAKRVLLSERGGGEKRLGPAWGKKKDLLTGGKETGLGMGKRGWDTLNIVCD